MRIARLDLLRYGKFTDRSVELPAGDHDIHILVGANEAGKSTTRHAIADLLYGIETQTRYGFLHGMPEMRLAARLEQAGQALEFLRRKGNKQTLRTLAGVVLPDAELVPYLGASDRAFFERMFGLDHARLVKGGAELLSASDDLGQMLFRSAAGLSGLGDAAQRLEDEADTLWGPRKKADRAYHAAAEAMEAAEAELKAATVKAKDWAKAQADLDEAAEAHDAAKALHAQLRAAKRVKERVRRSRPGLDLLQGIERAEVALGVVAPLPADARDTLAQAQATAALCGVEIGQHLAGLQAIAAELAVLVVDRPVIEAAAEVADLEARRLKCAGHPADIRLAEGMLASEWTRLRGLARQLGWRADTEDEVRAQMPPLARRARLQSLASLHATMHLKLEHAADSRAAKAGEVEELQAQVDGVATATLPAELPATLARLQRLGDTQATARALQQALDRAAQAEARACRATRLGSREFVAEAELQAVALPPDDLARRLVADEQADAANERATAHSIGELDEQIDQLNLEITQFKASHRTVELDAVLGARIERDSLWKAMLASPASLASQAPTYEGRVEAADQLADLRHDTARDASDLQERRHRLQALQLRRQRAQERLQSLQRARAERASAWLATASAAGVPELTAEELAGWRKLRAAALDAMAATVEARQAAQAHHRACSDLAHALALCLGEPIGPELAPDLQPLQERAQALLQEVEHAQVRQRSLALQLQAAQRALGPLDEALASAQSAASAWRAAWDQALRDAGLDPASSVDEVAATLRTIEAVDAASSAMLAIRNDRIAGPRAELATLAELARHLALRLAPDLADAEPADVALSLMERLHAARRAADEQASLQARQRLLQQQLDDATGRRDRAIAVLQPLQSRAGAADLEALALAIDRSDDQRRLAAERAQAEQALLAAGDGLNLAELRAEAECVDAATLMSDLEDIGSQEADLVDTLSRLAVELERAQQAMDLIGGSAAAAIAESRRQEALSRMTDAVERYVTLTTSARLLRWAIERFRESQQGPMLAGASGYFERLTGGSFERLVVDFELDPPTLEGRRADGSLVGVAGMSDGTRDQLFLALRLAALDMHLEAGHALPFIADDLFVNFDDDRSRAGFVALGALSRRTQVIYLTHHRHLAELARQALGPAVRIVDL
jgi:uncharacterized protein YhaN